MTGNAYDALAPFYAEYARTRAAYCNSVDRHILEWAPRAVASMLDVGSGDGVRAVRLAAAMSTCGLVLSDPSAPMVDRCRTHDVAEVWPCAAEALPGGSTQFDMVTCLWNVLGAVDGASRRSEALRRMASVLAPRGRLFIDVHNRYNVATAGGRRVAVRLCADLLRPSEANGAVAFTWHVAGRAIPSRGYLFTERETGRLFNDAGLRIVRQVFLDYDNGRRRGPWTGQMLFELERR